MAYLTIEAFTSGVDRSRPIYALPSGTLWECINAHISRGGDVEKRKSFVQKHSLPDGTFGLAADANGLVTFGGGVQPAGVPPEITYQRLQHPSSLPMLKLRSWDLFDGEVYAIAQYVDGDAHHFLDAARVTDWDGGGNFPVGKGTIAKTHKRKMYSPYGVAPDLGGSILGFSKLDDASQWDSVADAGAGFLNLSTHHAGSAVITGLGTYQTRLAALSPTVIQIWTMENDDALNAPFQTIPETGTRAPRSVREFGNLDLFYLSDSGVRSLRARDSTDAAAVQDVGTPIDALIIAYLATLTTEQKESACSVVDRDGRFWLAVGERIFVFTYFPSKKVSAWSWYEPGFEVSDFVKFNNQIWARSGNRVYLYGGDNDDEYDSCRVTVQLPFNAVRGKDGTFKQFEGQDIAASGEWDCKWLVDPNNESRFVHIGELENVTYSGPDGLSAGDGHFTHVAPLCVHEAAGAASLSKITLYHEPEENRG